MGKWGTWNTRSSCTGTNVFLVGAKLKSQRNQGSTFDDAAATGLNMKCSDGNFLGDFGSHPWGTWSEPAECPPKTAICGIITKVENHQWGDDTALNRVSFLCCKLPTAMIN